MELDYYQPPRVNPWLIAVCVALAAFMEVLDTSIASVALPYISGSIGASAEEGNWVITSYLVANAVAGASNEDSRNPDLPSLHKKAPGKTPRQPQHGFMSQIHAHRFCLENSIGSAGPNNAQVQNLYKKL